MKSLLIFLSIYFAVCFVMRVIRMGSVPHHPRFNTVPVNVGALVEYGALCLPCVLFAAENGGAQ
jgi:hypothetical protein